MKKFEEGVFSDLRNLKPGVDACLEEPKVSNHLHRTPSVAQPHLFFENLSTGRTWTQICRR